MQLVRYGLGEQHASDIELLNDRIYILTSLIIIIRITHPPSLIRFTNLAQAIDDSFPLIDGNNPTCNRLHGLDPFSRPG